MLAAHAALLSFPGYLQCARPMDHGGPWIMGLPVGTSTRRMTWSGQFRRRLRFFLCAGETLSLSMPTTGGQYMVEVSGGGSIAGGTTCSSTRSRRSSFTFPFYVTMPLYGLVEAWAGHASGYSHGHAYTAMLAVGTHGTTASAESAESSECFQRDREATAAGIDAHSDLRPRRLQRRLRLARFAALPLLQHAQRACFLLRMWLLCRRLDKSAEPAVPAEPTTTLLAAALAHPQHRRHPPRHRRRPPCRCCHLPAFRPLGTGSARLEGTDHSMLILMASILAVLLLFVVVVVVVAGRRCIEKRRKRLQREQHDEPTFTASTAADVELTPTTEERM